MAGQLVVAFDAAGVCGAVVSRGFGRLRVAAWAQATLPGGALEPAAVEGNLHQPERVRDALAQVVGELRAHGRPALLLLPAGVARTALLELPSGVEAAEYALFQLGPRLPYPASEALVDGVRAGRQLYLAGVVRRAVVTQYEEAAAQAGLRQARIDLAPLAGLAGLLRQRRDPHGLDVVLGDRAWTLAARRGAAWSEVRTRRRVGPGPEEDARLADAVERLLREDVGGGRAPIRVVGPGRAAAAAELEQRGHVVSAGWPGLDGPAAAAEAGWLGGVA